MKYSAESELFVMFRARIGRSARTIAGLMVLVACCVQCHPAAHSADIVNASAEMAVTAVVATNVTGRNASLARSEPFEFLQFCWSEYDRNVQDYRCTFAKQELIGGAILPCQKADVRFMENPFSVDMTFVENVRECKRALYVAGKWVDAEGNEQAWAKPGGAILRTFIPKIKQPVHGWRAKKASRRTIDQFGFSKSFELILHYSEKAQAEGSLELAYVGDGAIDGRPTFIFERRLPYNGDDSHYPDKLLVLHIDQEFLLPTACYAYADAAAQKLLGAYVYSDVKLNVGYTADDFDPDKIDF